MDSLQTSSEDEGTTELEEGASRWAKCATSRVSEVAPLVKVTIEPQSRRKERSWEGLGEVEILETPLSESRNHNLWRKHTVGE
jgi:hypothetical protein